MKAYKLLALGLMLTLAGAVSAQISVNVNIGSPPAWGPSGYTDARYYYLPDVEAYYDVRRSTFIYISGNRWVRSSYLPSHYRNYDLHRGYKVVMTNYRGNSPYTYYRQHKAKYGKGYRGGEQHSNRDHKNFKKNQRSGNQPPMERNSNHQSQKKNKGNDDRGHGNNKKDKR